MCVSWTIGLRIVDVTCYRTYFEISGIDFLNVYMKMFSKFRSAL